MTKILKNIADGVGSVFVDIGSGRGNPKKRSGGFREDAARLRGDAKTVVRGIQRNTEKAKNGKV